MSTGNRNSNIKIVKKSKKSTLAENKMNQNNNIFSVISVDDPDTYFKMSKPFFNDSDIDEYRRLYWEKHVTSIKDINYYYWELFNTIYANGSGEVFARNKSPLYGKKEFVDELEKDGLIINKKIPGVQGNHYTITDKGSRVIRIYNIFKNYKKIDTAKGQLSVSDEGIIDSKYNSFYLGVEQRRTVVDNKDVFYKYEKDNMGMVIVISDSIAASEKEILSREIKDRIDLSIDKKAKEYLKSLRTANIIVKPQLHYSNKNIIFSGVINDENVLLQAYASNIAYFYEKFGEDIEFRIHSKEIVDIEKQLENNNDIQPINKKGLNKRTGVLTLPLVIIQNGKIIGMCNAFARREKIKGLFKTPVNYNTEFEAINTLKNLNVLPQ